MSENNKMADSDTLNWSAVGTFLLSNIKWLGFALLVCVVAGSGYIIAAKPLYESSARVGIPAPNEVLQINKAHQLNEKFPVYTPVDFFNGFLKALFSEELRRSFFEKVYLPQFKRVAGADIAPPTYARFLTELSIAPADGALTAYTVSIRTPYPLLSRDLVTGLISLAGDQAGEKIQKDFTDIVDGYVTDLEPRMHLAVQRAITARRDQIVRLKEALAIAKGADIKRPALLDSPRGETAAKGEDPLYLQGTGALAAQIATLSTRERDEPFIPGFRELEMQDAQLRSFLAEGIARPVVFAELQSATTPDVPVHSRGLPTLLFFIGSGAIAGWLLVLLVRRVQAKRS